MAPATMAHVSPSTTLSILHNPVASRKYNTGRSLPPSSSSCSIPVQKLGVSRRLLLPALGISMLAAMKSSERAWAKDIPLFGIKKRVEQAEKEVVEEIKELAKEGRQLVKEGEKEIEGVVAAVPSFGGSIPPLYQAGAVAGAELVAVLLASSVVNGLVS